MKKIYIVSFLLIILQSLMLTSCDESVLKPNGEDETFQGKILKSALTIDVMDATDVKVRSANWQNNLTVTFRNLDSNKEFQYKYSEMPDVVTLPEGKYVADVECGDELDAEWEASSYNGVSEPFLVKANQITDNIGTIVCKLQNVKVTVEFGPLLESLISNVAVVDISMGSNENSPSLRFTSADVKAQRAGYFKYIEGVSMVALFSGEVEGIELRQQKFLTNIQPGCHYKILFRLHKTDDDAHGIVAGRLVVDASVTVVDLERNVTLVDDELLDDDERPREDGGDTVTWDGPTVTAESPLKLPAQNLWKPNNGKVTLRCEQVVPISNPNVNVALNFASKVGFTEFYADIESPTLTPEELQGVGLTPHLDLINPGSNAEALEGLGLPINVGGKKEVGFRLTNFMTLLAALGEGSHSFIVHAKDANGELVVTLVINVK